MTRCWRPLTPLCGWRCRGWRRSAGNWEMTAVVGTVERRGDRRFNSALVVGPDGYLATYDKMWLPGGECEYFEPGEDALSVVDSQGWRFAVGICADLQRGDYFRLAADAGRRVFPALRGRERDARAGRAGR